MIQQLKILLTGFLILLLQQNAGAQYGYRIWVKDSSTQQPVAGVTVTAGNKNSMTAKDGTAVIDNLFPVDSFTLSLSAMGYQTLSVFVSRPDTLRHVIYLTPLATALEDITIISSTRTNSSIENAPLKVEVLGREELEEENTIKPGNIASILGDVSGIQVQQSSAVSGNANVRIQGLEGRYTQILRDGLPLFDGFSGGFGILSVPPLDLKQIELIKGSASTLYGGGAIGGLINLISRKPSKEGEAMLTLNQTTLRESNVNTFLSKKYKHAGYTFYGGYTGQHRKDVDGDGFTDVPQLRSVIVHPRLFWYPAQNVSIALGYTGTFEKRDGGDLAVLAGKKDGLHQYFEKNTTQRHSEELIAEATLTPALKATVKGSVSSFTRALQTAGRFFKGAQTTVFTEASLLGKYKKLDAVAGINYYYKGFRQKPSDPIPLNAYNNSTAGAFAQATLHLHPNTTIEAGLRNDNTAHYENIALPRIALFHRFTEAWAMRAGFGMGYKIPDALSPQTTDYDIETIQPLPANVHAERSYGYNAEVNYKKPFDERHTLFINHAFFLTSIKNPVIAMAFPNTVSFSNASGNIITGGFDTYVQAELAGWELYIGYTYTIAKRAYLHPHQWLPLAPKNRMAFTIVKELPKWRGGLEGSYTGRQYRDGDSRTQGYLFLAAMVQRTINDHISLVLNGENLLDYRQSRYETLYTGTITHPVFKPLWAPIDGRVINLSIRFKL